MQKKLGTNAISSLNVAKGPHLIEDHELRESYNGWTDEDGVWRSAPGPTVLYSNYDAISCLAAGRMAGVDHVVWLDGNTLYDNGTNVGTITAGTTMDIVALDDSFLILGAAKNYIWDGTHLREQGTWQIGVSTDSGIYQLAKTEYTVTAITKATEAKITTSIANVFAVGDYAYVVGGDMPEITDRPYRVTSIDSATHLWFTVACDSTNFTTYTTGATVDLNACGLMDGEYKFYLTGTIELASGVVLEGMPIGLGRPDEQSGFAWDTSSPETYTIAEQTDRLLLECIVTWAVAGVPNYTISGTIGVDYTPGLRLYRTKANGYDWYLEKEWTYGDADFVYAPGASAYFAASYTVHVPDNELGAVYVPGLMDHGNAPQSDVGALAGQRVLLASGSDIYWSSLDGIEYYNNGTGFTPLGDVVTAIAPFRDGWAVFSCDRLWYVQIPDGLPTIVEINTPVGTVWPKAMTTTDAGVLFLRPDGLWLFDGARVSKISRRAFASILEPSSVVQAGEVLYVSGSEKSYIAQTRDNGWEWHESEHYRPFADSTNGEIYAADLFHVEQLFTGRRTGGRLSTKHYGDGSQNKAIKAVLDIEGDTVPTVWLNGNRQSDYIGHVDESPTTDRLRRRVWVSIPRYNNQYVYLTLETTGDIKVYGIEFECAG